METGGTIGGGIKLVDKQGGIVAGIATLCIEQRDSTKRLREQFKCATVVRSSSDYQRQCNRQVIEREEGFDPCGYLPDLPP